MTTKKYFTLLKKSSAAIIFSTAIGLTGHSSQIENQCATFYFKNSLSAKDAKIREQQQKALEFNSTQKKVLIVSDAWSISNKLVANLNVTHKQIENGEIRNKDTGDGQINGVVKTLANTTRTLEENGHTVDVIHPDLFKSIVLPNYKAIGLAVITPKVYRDIEARIKEFGPNNLHIATEGPLGWAVRRIAIKNGWKFTTSYHTQFPEYVNKFTFGFVPVSLGYHVLRKFHSPADAVLVTTPTMEKMLHDRGFQNTEIWTRGVDTKKFTRQDIKSELRKGSGALYTSFKETFQRAKATKNKKHDVINDYENFDSFLSDVLNDKIKFALYVGRVSIEKGIEDFLDQDTQKLPGKVVKLIVGPGPNDVRADRDQYLIKLQQKYPGALFFGGKEGQDLLEHYSLGHVFVFPSRTDTFGNVVIEAMAMAMPVVAYNVVGPGDIIANGLTGVLVNKKSELLSGIEQAFKLNPEIVHDGTKDFLPEIAFNQIITNFVEMRQDDQKK